MIRIKLVWRKNYTSNRDVTTHKYSCKIINIIVIIENDSIWILHVFIVTFDVLPSNESPHFAFLRPFQLKPNNTTICCAVRDALFSTNRFKTKSTSIV